MELPLDHILQFGEIAQRATDRWGQQVTPDSDWDKLTLTLRPEVSLLPELCTWLFSDQGYSFATIVVEEQSSQWELRYIFYGPTGAGQVHVLIHLPLDQTVLPSISPGVHAADWQEREAEDLFGLTFKGHPHLGDFVLHDQWPEGVNPMRSSFNPDRSYHFEMPSPSWRPNRILQAAGAFMMPLGPVYAGHAESAHFLLETVGEDVAHTIPRFFYKYRGVEKIAEGKSTEWVLLLSERFSGTSAFAHSLAYCQALEQIMAITPPPRARNLRVLFAELERFRHHVSAIGAICSSTALSVAAAQFHILEEDLIRLTCAASGHRYLFGLNTPGGLTRDLSDTACSQIGETIGRTLQQIRNLYEKLRFTSSFLDRLEEVGTVSHMEAISYGLVGPVARASGVSRDLREHQPYAGYDAGFQAPHENEGDGYARLRVLIRESERSSDLIHHAIESLRPGPIRESGTLKAGAALGWVEAPRGAAFHWVRVNASGEVIRYRVMTPSFINWHGFHLAAEDFAFQDFPIIMATFGLSNAECDR